MRNSLWNISKMKAAILVLSFVLPLHVSAADLYSSTLNNQTKQYDPEGKGYILEKVATWGNGCVASKGKQRLTPGETTVLEIRKSCEWAGVKYKMIKNKETVGSVAHSFRDKSFALEISLPCKGNTCNLTGLPPSESSSKK